jgi:hypothetical protein
MPPLIESDQPAVVLETLVEASEGTEITPVRGDPARFASSPSISSSGGPSPETEYAIRTPSLVVAYWTPGPSMAAG